MQDFQQTIQVALDYLKGIWKRKRYLIIFSWLVCPLGFAYVASMPDVYRSEAQVYVDTRSMLAPILKDIAIPNDPQAEVKMMAQTLKSRANIEEIAREADLDISVTTDADYEELIADLTDDIILSRTSRSNIYTISYEDEDAQVARNVVQETLDVFVEGSLGGNRKGSDQATRFIDEEIAEYESRLSEAEQQRANFLRQHADILPQKESFNDKLNRLIDDLDNTRLEIREYEERANVTRARLEKMTSRSTSNPGSINQNSLTTRYDTRIEGLEQHLDDLRLRFTDKHPDIIEGETLLANLKKQRQSDIDDFLAQNDASNVPVLNEMAQETTLELNNVEGQIASLKVREENYVEKIAELRSKIDLVPQIEAEGLSKNRNYNIIKKNYEDLLRRKEAAEISQRADVSAEELQFRIIQPPLIPAKPTGPHRFIAYTGVLVLGFGAGIGIAFLLSQITPVLVRAHQLTSITGFPVLGVVSHLNIEEIRKRSRIKLILFLASSSLIFFMYALLVAADIMNVDLLGKVLA